MFIDITIHGHIMLLVLWMNSVQKLLFISFLQRIPLLPVYDHKMWTLQQNNDFRKIYFWCVHKTSSSDQSHLFHMGSWYHLYRPIHLWLPFWNVNIRCTKTWIKTKGKLIYICYDILINCILNSSFIATCIFYLQ